MPISHHPFSPGNALRARRNNWFDLGWFIFVYTQNWFDLGWFIFVYTQVALGWAVAQGGFSSGTPPSARVYKAENAQP